MPKNARPKSKAKAKPKSLISSNPLQSMPKNKRLLVIAILAIVVVGIITLLASRAATGPQRVEAEDGSRTGNISVAADTTASGGSYIQFGAPDHGGHGGTGCATGPTITAYNICINPASIKAPAKGSNAFLDGPGGYTPRSPHGPDSNFAAFRTECEYSHVSKNDPIVYPGKKDAAHWHMFFGNTASDENLTDPATQGNSTCSGGRHNNTSYWAPLLVDTKTYNSATKQYNAVEPIEGDPMQVYYKSGYEGVPASTIVPFPPGFRMIAGNNPSVTPTSNSRHVTFECINSARADDIYNGIKERDSIPTDCPAGKIFQATVTFPQCGAVNPNGSPVLDSPDHRSHVAYGAGWPNLGCPSSHPRAYPEVKEHFRWKVPATGASGLKFSSDIYGDNVPAGRTFHADWFNGWNQPTLTKIVNNCFKINQSAIPGGYSSSYGVDCQMNLFEPNGNTTSPWRTLLQVPYEPR